VEELTPRSFGKGAVVHGVVEYATVDMDSEKRKED
jgi:hypothetical protein